jgi:hypothetical protein
MYGARLCIYKRSLVHLCVDLPHGMARLGYGVGEEVVVAGSGGGGGSNMAGVGRPNQRGEGASANSHENKHKNEKEKKIFTKLFEMMVADIFLCDEKKRNPRENEEVVAEEGGYGSKS